MKEFLNYLWKPFRWLFTIIIFFIIAKTGFTMMNQASDISLICGICLELLNILLLVKLIKLFFKSDNV